MDGSQASVIGQHHYLSTLILTLISISIILFTFIFRAKEEAGVINSTKHGLLDNVGGSVSLEMQLPKLLWLRR